MFTFLISLTIAGGVVAGLGCTETTGWIGASIWGVVAFFASQLCIGMFFQKRVRREMEAVQDVMKDGQRTMQRLTDSWRLRPPSGIKQAQDELFKLQKRSVEAALERSKSLERYARWVPMMTRQIATLRLQLYWMIKDFKKADECMKRALFLDPMVSCLKIARGYMVDPAADPGAAFEKAVRRVAYGKSALLFGIYSWILVQQGKIDEAHRILIRGCEKNDHQTLKNNRENLANNRVAHFSNSGFGDEWYSLFLEEPKMKMQRRPQNFGRPF